MYKFLQITKVDNFDKYINKTRIFLSDLVIEYPLHNKWFAGVVKELKDNTFSREILIVLNNSDEIVGVSILKKTKLEKKICTLRVAKEYQHKGIGTMLIKKSLYYLDTDKPIITVSGNKHNEFIRLFKRFNFCLNKVYFGKYRNLTIEYCYNGILSPETILGSEELEHKDYIG